MGIVFFEGELPGELPEEKCVCVCAEKGSWGEMQGEQDSSSWVNTNYILGIYRISSNNNKL